MTANYYDTNADTFFTSTVNVDMSPLQQRFLQHLPAKAHILDAGCGSGRDAKAFADLGHQVTAFDASAELASRATAHCGFEVAVRTFDDVTEVEAYDGIWCCASLLHVPRSELPTVLGKLWRALRPRGVLYVSFKRGTGEREAGGRRFTDLEPEELERLLLALPQRTSKDVWLTEDQRPGRLEWWVNAVVRRSESSVSKAPSALQRWHYADSIETFLVSDPEYVLGTLVSAFPFAVEPTQRHAWMVQIKHLQQALKPYPSGKIYFEYSIPRMGKRADVIVIFRHVIWVLEYKVGEQQFPSSAVAQVWDYALDLKHFHEPSHEAPIVPVLISTESAQTLAILATPSRDGTYSPVCVSPDGLGPLIEASLQLSDGPTIDASVWENGRYAPTPTIVEAATALYAGHGVQAISRSDAGAKNLARTAGAIEDLIEAAKARSQKVICLVTGVPGAGKTLVGLNVATKHNNPEHALYAVYLSGNGPLVAILHEALARDQVERERSEGHRCTKAAARQRVKQFIQNVHHFRDTCLQDADRPPIEHVVIFDEAQRAWNLEQTSAFMQRKKGIAGFEMSEPEFLISCLDRHSDWAVVICLIGDGQEINTGEAGITEWLAAVERRFQSWHVYVSSDLLHRDSSDNSLLIQQLQTLPNLSLNDDLHLSVSMRSFRAEHVAGWVKAVLDLDRATATRLWGAIKDRYPIVITRDLALAKTWLRTRARGSERYGMVVSSQAERLKPHAIDVRSPMDPVHWFLDDSSDVRSSYYLEDVATEFHVQGLELDWACVVWDADFRHQNQGWAHHSFKGNRWQRIRSPERQTYQKNAYRVLLTRARQGMVIVVPHGDPADPTRAPEFYESTYQYLQSLNLPVLE